MTRPNRDMFATSRLYRLVPDRETLQATTERQEPLASIVDCVKGQNNESESSQLVELNTEGRVYQLPVLQCRLRNYTPEPKHLLKSYDGTIWEIRRQDTSADNLFYVCQCVRLREHVPAR